MLPVASQEIWGKADSPFILCLDRGGGGGRFQKTFEGGWFHNVKHSSADREELKG